VSDQFTVFFVISQHVPLTFDHCVLAVEVVDICAECAVKAPPYTFNLAYVAILAQQSIEWVSEVGTIQSLKI
jgi:hypothetical protein